MTTRSARLLLPLTIAIVSLAGCTSAPPAPSSSAASRPPVASSAPSAVASSGPAPSLSPSASVAPAASGPTIPPPEAGWVKVWPGPSDTNALLASVIATDAGFVAAGSDHTGRTPVAVSSSDGVTWSAEAIGGDARNPYALVPWGDRILAVGAGEAPCAHPYGLNSWVRTSAGAWIEAPFVDMLCDGSDVHPAIVGDVAVIVGSGPGDNPIVWSSIDGLHWVDHSAPFAGILPRAVVSDGQSAVLIAEGPTGTWSASSTNGTTWTAPSLIPGLPGGLQIHGAFWIDGGPTIIASQGGVLGTIRSDGSGAWTTTTATGLTSDLLGTITPFDGGLLAVGGAGSGPQAWVSRNGSSWRSLVLPPEVASDQGSIGGAAVREGRAILIGAVAKGADNAVSSIWTGSADLLRP